MNTPTCLHCRLKPGCELRAQKIASVRGLGLTTIKWSCSRRDADLPPGTVVDASMPHVGGDGPGNPPYPGVMRAIVMRRRENKATLYFPVQGQEDGSQFLRSHKTGEEVCVLRVNVDCLTETGEAVAICPLCYLPPGVAATDTRLHSWYLQLQDTADGGKFCRQCSGGAA